MNLIRPATDRDICRLCEIEIFNYRLNFYPIFKNDDFYFQELQVSTLMEGYLKDIMHLENTFVYDDGVIKGFIRVEGKQIVKLFVEPVLHSQGIGSALLSFALTNTEASFLWALEKNFRAIAFYQNHGFRKTEERIPEEGTEEYLIKLSLDTMN